MAANTKKMIRRVMPCGILRGKPRGQATIELALSLPFLIWLISYTFNAYYMMHTSHVGQKYAAMHLYKSLNNRAQFVVDGADPANPYVHGKKFMAIQYIDSSGEVPKRRILFAPRPITNVVGICREPDCK